MRFIEHVFAVIGAVSVAVIFAGAVMFVRQIKRDGWNQ